MQIEADHLSDVLCAGVGAEGEEAAGLLGGWGSWLLAGRTEPAS